jgi:ribosomal protein L7/L12
LAADPGRKIEAIKVYREETGAGLAEAKEAIESFINGM